MNAKLNRIDPNKLANNPRASLSAWSKFAPTVLAAYRLHPNPYLCTPQDLSIKTFVSRIREAIRGAIAFSYVLDSGISTDDLTRWYDEVIITEYNPTTVFIGPAKTLQESKPVQTTTPSSTSLDFRTLTWEEFEAFVLLISSGRMQVSVTIRKPDPTMLAFVSPSPNLTILSRPDGSLVLL